MTTHELKLTVEAVDPLVVSQFAGSETSHATLDYLPGTAVLGALAAAALDADWQAADGDFRRCFLLGEVSFGDANPAPDGSAISAPVPRSWATIKGQKGFTPEDSDKSSHVFDLAAHNRTHAEVAHDEQAKLIRNRKGLIGMDRDGAAEAAKLEDIREGYVANRTYFKIPRHVRTHTAIDPNRRAAAEAQLYSYENIPAGTKFIAVLRSMNLELLDKLASLLPAGKPLRFGRARASGYGRATVTRAERGEATPKHPEFTPRTILTLHSDLVLPHGCIGIEGVLKAFHGIEAVLKGVWSQFRSVQSFHAKWGLPRDTAQAIVRGSVFLLDINEEAFGKLAGLRLTGLGLRTHEGFGRFSLNDAHLHPEDPWRNEIRQKRDAGKDDPKGDIKRPTDPILRPAFDRWLQRQADVCAERLLFSPEVSALLDFADLIAKGQPPNSQLNALRMALAKGDKEACELLKNVKGRDSQWRKWDNCHVKSHFHDDGVHGFGAYIAVLLDVQELADKPNQTANQWLKASLKGDPFGGRVSDELAKDFIDRVRRSFIDQLLRSIVAMRRKGKNNRPANTKEAAHA